MVHFVERKVKSMPLIKFNDQDFQDLNPDYDTSMVISTELVEYDISKVLDD